MNKNKGFKILLYSITIIFDITTTIQSSLSLLKKFDDIYITLSNILIKDEQDDSLLGKIYKMDIDKHFVPKVFTKLLTWIVKVILSKKIMEWADSDSESLWL